MVSTKELRERQALSLEDKIRFSQVKIQEWYEAYDGKVYVSFSGGKDSTVLLHLVRAMYPDVPAVFCDTGLEFPEIKEFIHTFPNVIRLKPKMSFKQVIEKYGYPIVSKDQAGAIHRYNKTTDPQQKYYRLKGYPNGPKGKISDKWRFLLAAPFKISDQCCEAIKKAPLKSFARKQKKHGFIGNKLVDSAFRKRLYLKHGCNQFDLREPCSVPIAIWRERDVWEYLNKNKVPFSKIYAMGYDRTGCIFCGFGLHQEEKKTGTNRFKLMKQTHPKLWTYCMENLGMAEVLDYIGVKAA